MTLETEAVFLGTSATEGGEPGLEWFSRVNGRTCSPVAANDQVSLTSAVPKEPLSFVLADLVRNLARADRILQAGRQTVALRGKR